MGSPRTVAERAYVQVWELHFTNSCNIYKTTRYDLPFFFVCVRTNVGYCTVAEFIMQKVSASSNGEALDILKQWNPTWNPTWNSPVILCDYSEAEFSAIKSTFTSTLV